MNLARARVIGMEAAETDAQMEALNEATAPGGAIYTDGHSLEITRGEADELDRRELVERHPGAGSDGITAEDWKLADGVEWAEVFYVIGRGQ